MTARSLPVVPDAALAAAVHDGLAAFCIAQVPGSVARDALARYVVPLYVSAITRRIRCDGDIVWRTQRAMEALFDTLDRWPSPHQVIKAIQAVEPPAAQVAPRERRLPSEAGRQAMMKAVSDLAAKLAAPTTRERRVVERPADLDAIRAECEARDLARRARMASASAGGEAEQGQCDADAE